jgi:phage terminase large subunit GpA-like protein
LRVFTNTVDAKTRKETGEAPDWQRLYERAQAEAVPYSRTVPQGALFPRAGADLQKDRIEVQVVAGGRAKESWLVDYEVLQGDTSRPEVWAKLTLYANRTFPQQSGTIFRSRDWRSTPEPRPRRSIPGFARKVEEKFWPSRAPITG